MYPIWKTVSAKLNWAHYLEFDLETDLETDLEKNIIEYLKEFL